MATATPTGSVVAVGVRVWRGYSIGRPGGTYKWIATPMMESISKVVLHGLVLP